MSTNTESDLEHRPPMGKDDRDTTEVVVPAGATRLRVRPGAIGSRVGSMCEPFWADPRIGLSAVAAAAAVWGLTAGRWTPRGPLTTSQAIWSIVISLVVGGLGGLLMRSRWAILIGPLVFAVAFELTRLGTDGPTVDTPALTTYGILALVVGRGFHALISLAPMAFGAVIGAGITRHLGDTPASEHQPQRWGLRARRSVAVVAAVGLVAFTVLLARPATTDPIVDADGNRVPGSIAELSTIGVNGHDLDVMIRGHNVDNPVLLFLAGGPGGSELGAMRNHLPGLEEHFTVVTWDQRGTGKAYDELDPTGSYTLNSAVDDTIAVTNHLRDRFGQDGIYLLGQSWGSTLGVLAVQQHPELYTAFIGVGQMVSQLDTDRIFYEDTIEWAAENDAALADKLQAIGPPPYADMLDYETALSYEHEVYPYDHSANSEGEGGFSENFFVSEYSLTEQIHLLGAFMDTFSVLYPQLQDIDFRRTATDFEIPMYFVQGAHEADGRADVFADWYPMINAPLKDVVTLETSGHRPLFEQPDEFIGYMVDVVLIRTTD
jgi:proline iminopeptidase